MAAFDRGPEARNARHILGPGPAAQLLTAAPQQRLEAEQALGQNQGANALGAADLVRRKRYKIGIHRIDIKRYFSKCLNRIDMQQSACAMDDIGHFRDRLNGAGFVVGRA